MIQQNPPQYVPFSLLPWSLCFISVFFKTNNTLYPKLNLLFRSSRPLFRKSPSLGVPFSSVSSEILSHPRNLLWRLRELLTCFFCEIKPNCIQAFLRKHNPFIPSPTNSKEDTHTHTHTLAIQSIRDWITLEVYWAWNTFKAEADFTKWLYFPKDKNCCCIECPNSVSFLSSYSVGRTRKEEN